MSMSTPDDTVPVLCGICDDTLVPVATPCAVVQRPRSAAVLVCRTCGTRQTRPAARGGDYFDIVMRVRAHRPAARRRPAM
ncbi:hypothetical protein [Rhodoplanes elegans]|uniref:hypothetical protein n=1 Tax=Rhodoplanes elegans TaxID=29408 RepID=UPI0019128DE3|nr:hypothetical protein [Rhodoplanes elegans]